MVVHAQFNTEVKELKQKKLNSRMHEKGKLKQNKALLFKLGFMRSSTKYVKMKVKTEIAKNYFQQ